MDVVKETNHHVKMLLARVTPALPILLPSIKLRIQRTINEDFPQDIRLWETIKPVNKVVHCISQAVTLTTFGPPICDDPKLIRLCSEHTLNGKDILLVVFLPFH
jgi:hypothetical protein